MGRREVRTYIPHELRMLDTVEFLAPYFEVTRT